MADLEKVIKGLECKLNANYDTCKDCKYFEEELAEGNPVFKYFCNRSQIEADALELLKAQEEAKEEVSGTLDKLIKETQDLLSKAPTDFDIVKGIIERSSLRKHFDEAIIETGERIITLRHGADEVDLLFDKEGRIE